MDHEIVGAFVTVDCAVTRALYRDAPEPVRAAVRSVLRGRARQNLLGREGGHDLPASLISRTNAGLFCRVMGVPLGRIVLQGFRICVDSPRSGGTVGPFDPVEGRVFGPVERIAGQPVWVTIYPLGSWYWVQRPALIASDRGGWRAETFFGDAHTRSGQEFHVRACLFPTRPLRVAETLPGWPDAEHSSDVIVVRRK